eukprot:1183147-Prymnesium_polylepis.2
MRLAASSALFACAPRGEEGTKRSGCAAGGASPLHREVLRGGGVARSRRGAINAARASGRPHTCSFAHADVLADASRLGCAPPHGRHSGTPRQAGRRWHRRKRHPPAPVPTRTHPVLALDGGEVVARKLPRGVEARPAVMELCERRLDPAVVSHVSYPLRVGPRPGPAAKAFGPARPWGRVRATRRLALRGRVKDQHPARRGHLGGLATRLEEESELLGGPPCSGEWRSHEVHRAGRGEMQSAQCGQRGVRANRCTRSIRRRRQVGGEFAL